MNQSTMFVGLDVHKEGIEIALAPSGGSEVRPYGRRAGDLDAVDKVIRNSRERHQQLNLNKGKETGFPRFASSPGAQSLPG